MPRHNAFRRLAAMTCGWVLLVGPATTTTARAQETEPLGWSNVLKLRTGEEIDVALDGAKYFGQVTTVDPDSLQITTKKDGPLIFPRATVKTVRDHGRLRKPGLMLMSLGILFVGSTQLVSALREANELSQGRLPRGDPGFKFEVVGLSVVGVGAWMMATGGGKTIYRRLVGKTTAEQKYRTEEIAQREIAQR